MFPTLSAGGVNLYLATCIKLLCVPSKSGRQFKFLKSKKKTATMGTVGVAGPNSIVLG